MILKLTFAHPLSVGYLIKSNLQAARGICILFKTEAPHKRPGKEDKTQRTSVTRRVTDMRNWGELPRKGYVGHVTGDWAEWLRKAVTCQTVLQHVAEEFARIALSRAAFSFVG